MGKQDPSKIFKVNNIPILEDFTLSANEDNCPRYFTANALASKSAEMAKVAAYFDTYLRPLVE